MNSIHEMLRKKQGGKNNYALINSEDHKKERTTVNPVARLFSGLLLAQRSYHHRFNGMHPVFGLIKDNTVL